MLSESGLELVVHVYFKFQDNEYKNFQEVSQEIENTSHRFTDWEKISAKYIFDKGLLSKIYKELLKLKNKKSRNPI